MSNIGRRLGYCGGAFGRLEFGPNRVEAEGWDWIVARGPDDIPRLVYFENEVDKQMTMADWDSYAEEEDDDE